MKILFIHTCNMMRDGEDSAVANEIELLRSHGIEAELLSFNNDGKNAFLKLLQMPFNFKSYWAVKKKIRSFKPHIVHIHQLHFAASPSVIYAAKSYKVPVVYTLHNYNLLCPSGLLFFKEKMFMNSINKSFPLEAVKKKVYLNSRSKTFWFSFTLWLHQTWRTWNTVDRFIVYSEYAKKIFVQSKLHSIADKMEVVPNFCIPYDDRSVEEQDEGYYIYVGTLTYDKGIPVMLEAFADNKLPLKIIGNGPLEPLVKGYGLHYPNIRFVGYKPKDEVFNLLEHATALIFPSLWLEPFGMVIAEAFSKGIPVIACDQGNLKEMINSGYNGLKFETNNDKELRIKVDYYEALSIEEKAVYRRNAKNTYLKKYAPELHAEQLLNIYQSLL